MSSDDEMHGHVGLVNMRIVRRHSSTVDPRRQKSDSLLEGGSSTSSISVAQAAIIENRLTGARPVSVVPRKSGVTQEVSDTPMVDEEEEDASPSQSRGGILSCLGCFNGPKARRTSGGFERLSGAQPAGPTASALAIPMRNIHCEAVQKILMLMSERVEIETLDPLDQRVVFLLFSALSGEPLLNEAEYPECDDWVDWLQLGYSSSPVDAFERDVNRHGSQSMGLLFQLFFAIEFTETARLCAVIIRNVHFDPSALFGLFAINCCKWSRDVVISAMRSFDASTKSGASELEVPPLFTSAAKIEGRFKNFTTILDWWISSGAWGRLDTVEFPSHDSADSVGRHTYENFEEESSRSSISSDGMPEVVKRRVTLGTAALLQKSSSNGVGRPRAESSVDSERPPLENCRIAEIDLSDPADLALLNQTMIVGGVYYTYCVLAFTKFWLEKDLISVDTDVARERLNNAYLDKEFVSKLKLSPSVQLPDLVKKVGKLQLRVHQLWKASGWKEHDLLMKSRLTPTHSPISESDEE